MTPRSTQVVSDVLGRVGATGVVSAEAIPDCELSLTMVDGVEFNHCCISPNPVTDNERMETLFENPSILLSNKKVTQVQDLVRVLELIMRSCTEMQAVILAENIEGPALSRLVSNNVHKTPFDRSGFERQGLAAAV